MLSRKVLGLTKPKGKIYKTKSLGHYITLGDGKDAAAVAGGEGLMGGESNGSGGGSHFCGFKMVISGGGMGF